MEYSENTLPPDGTTSSHPNNSWEQSELAEQGNIAAWNDMTNTTRILVEDEINNLRLRLNSILDEQRINTEYLLGIDSSNGSANHVYQNSAMEPDICYSPQPYSADHFSDQVMICGNDNGNVLTQGSANNYFNCEPDDKSDLSMHSAHYSEEMIENRKNLYVMRILTSIMKIHNSMKKS